MIMKRNHELSNFYLFMLGQFVSQFGSRLTGYGLILWSYKQSGSVLSISLLSVCYLVPEILLSFLSGGISDQWNKKKIMLVSDTVAAILSLATLLMLFSGSLRLEYLYAINFMLGVMDSFQQPASEVTISAIVTRDNYMRTNGFRTFCNSFIGILAPVTATSLYALFGLKVIVVIDLTTFVFAFTTLAFLVKIPHRTFASAEQTVLEQCIYGIKFLIRQRSILSLILFMAFKFYSRHL